MQPPSRLVSVDNALIPTSDTFEMDGADGI